MVEALEQTDARRHLQNALDAHARETREGSDPEAGVTRDDARGSRLRRTIDTTACGPFDEGLGGTVLGRRESR